MTHPLFTPSGTSLGPKGTLISDLQAKVNRVWPPLQESLEGAVLFCDDFDKAAKHQAFSRTEEEKRPPVFTKGSLQITWKLAQFVKDVSIKWDNQYCFQSLETTMYGGRKWLQTSKNHLVVVRYL